jgi:hypothetical protein
MKESYDGLTRETLIAMIEEAVEQIEDLQGFLRSIERQIKEFRRRPPRDLLGRDDPPRPRRL